MASSFTEEQLRLAIGNAVINNCQLTENRLIEELFGPSKSNLPSVLRSLIRKEFFRQCKNFCRFSAKNWIVNRLKNGSSDFIKKFVAAQETNQILKEFPADLQARLVILVKEDAIGSLLIECSRLFNKLREKFVPAQSEDRFRDFLARWLQCGFMSLNIRRIFDQWKQNGANLKNLKSVQWPSGSENDSNWRQLQNLLKNIKTDNFVETEKLQTILNLLLAKPIMRVNNLTIKLTGRTVFLREWMNTIQDSIRKNNATQVEIFAEDSIGIDCDLTDPIWQGKNLVITTKVVYLWQNSKICLSGKGFQPGKSKAASATSTVKAGADGDYGRPGESSGNIAILATKMFNPARLTVELNGGRGEDGQDGGDGCDGKNGVGVTQSDLDGLIVSYTSLYLDWWSTFQKYSPLSNWVNQSDSSSSGEYIHRTYKDEHGREMTFSFAADKGWIYTTYELYLLIRGTNGTSGTSGGSNGVGGQGGYNGTSIVQNPESGEQFQINIVRNGKSSGPNGNDGVVGTSGKHGINGNDMALIDRSAKEASKHYEGSTDKKLTSSYVYTAESKSRLDGKKRYVDKENACFIKFGLGDPIDTSERRAVKAQQRTVRTATSEAVAKQSIIVSKVLTESEAMFGKEDAFLADACKATAEAAVDANDEDEEEEAAENVTEEFVVLRQKEEVNKLAKYTPDSEKKERPVHTPETYANYLKSLRRKTTWNASAQLLFDLFTIEFPPKLLDSIALKMLFHRIKYLQKTQHQFAVVIIAALQAKIVNGKTYNEVRQFNDQLVVRHKRKLQTTRLRQKIENLTLEMDALVVNPSMNIVPGANKHFGIEEAKLSTKLIPYKDPTNVKQIVKSFFSQYVHNQVDTKLLMAFNQFLKTIQPYYHEQFALFVRNDAFQWTDNDAVAQYFHTLKAWLVEKSASKDKKTKSKDKKNDDDDHMQEEESSKRSMREKTKLEQDFETFLNAVVDDFKYWSHMIKPINELINGDKQYKARFGAPISFDQSNAEKSIDQAQHLIKIYFLAKTILNYNQRLYICNAMMLKEQGKFPDEIRCFNTNDFDSFLLQNNTNPVPSNSDQCEVYMTSHGLACAPFRYLLSLFLNIKLCSYRKVSFQTLQLVETLNSMVIECEILWLQKDRQPVGIAPDREFRKLVAAQMVIVEKYNDNLSAEIGACINLDYTKKENLLAFASYFPQPLQNAAIEWVENYIAISRDQLLIRLLHNRLWIDGCHFSVFELQFVLVSCASLTTLYYCNLNYLLLLVSSVPQTQFVDVLLYLRIEYHYRNRFSPSSKIFTGIQLIPSTRYKALLAVKMSDYNSPIDENDLYKIILMLQHASNGSEQLVKMGLDEWISIAQKQKWSEIGYLLKQYGSIGYYLGVLDNKGFKDEENKMREIINQATIIPEKIIALYTQWIVTGEVHADEKFFNDLKRYFTQANNYPELQDRITKHQLLTTEVEQARLINWLATGKISENHVNYEKFTSMADRNVDMLAEKITGLHDAPEYIDKRRESIRNIAQLLKSNDGAKSLNIHWLKKFDDELFNVKKKRLRDSQKMAVLCAVESEKHVLEQVNTGEGKSFIIAAIATIRCKTGKRYVDIITSSPVLAKRDADEMKELYKELGLNVADNCSEDLEERKKAYTADIVYGDIGRFQRDYLLHRFYKKPLKGDRTQVAVIVDEVDNMLLDNGNNMLYLSHSVPGMDLLDSLLIFIQQQIHSPIYTGDKNDLGEMQKQFDSTTIKEKVLADLFGRFSLMDLARIVDPSYTQPTIQTIFDKLIQGKIIDADGYLKIYRHDEQESIKNALTNVDGALIIRIQACFSVIMSRERSIEIPPYLRDFAKLHLDEFIENCKHALFLEPNTGYVVDVDHTGKLTTVLEPVVTIIDSNTGADLATSQWCGGLHQFLQLKHGCRLSPISLKAVFVSNVAYLKGYKHINGLSGTLGSIEESKTLIELYGADLIKIPTSKPKIFYEHVPAIATVQEEWIQNIYNEICDQIRGTRSVLLICEDIKQLEYFLNGLDACFVNDKKPSKSTVECFTNITVYKREHDEFHFEEGHELEPHRLIIATNLAGRGTDIKLKPALINAGGLHVITAFMPKNCRIEEQAFGRAARCGQPGSAQIITFADKTNDTIEPSVFQLKMFRDNAEVHRLQSLKSFYDFHTEIEELCLEKFGTYCDQALSAIYSKSSTANDESLPTPSQVVYFALLDQWALWLDAKAPLINQCAKEPSQHAKKTLINSVDDFRKIHPFGNSTNCFEVAKTWIKAPQSLLTIGIIQMHHDNGFQEAENTFNRIIADGHEFAAEAHYYKACMRMKNFGGSRSAVKSLTLSSSSKEFPTNIDEAIEHFYKARTLFLLRLQRKQREAAIVTQMVKKTLANNPKTSGFVSQLSSITTYTQLILTNIDFLLGAPCKPEMFAQDNITEAYSKEIYESFYRQGVVSPTLLTDRKIEDWQVEPFRQKYKFSKDQLQILMDSMTKDIYASAFDKHIVLEQSVILEKCPLSTKAEFWAELEMQKALLNTEFYVIIHDRSLLSKEVLDKFNQLQPYSNKADPEGTRSLVRYSNEKDIGTVYKYEEVEKLMKKDPKFDREVDELIEKDSLKLDKMASVLLVPSQLGYFSEFDGVTTNDLKGFFNLNNHGAGWIMNRLQENGIFQLQTVSMTRCTLNEEIWTKLVRIHLRPDAKKPEKAPIELELLFEHAVNLEKIKINRKILNITEEVINSYCKISSEIEKEPKLKQFYDYLIKAKILEPYIYNIWRLNSKLDCSSLPSCIANQIDEFLADRFAYSFALENLCHSLKTANNNPNPTPSQVFLPETPFATVFDDLVNYGFAIPPRICSSLNDINDIDYEDFKYGETIKSVAQSNRLKLFDQTDYHVNIIPFSTYVLDQGFTIDSDLRNMINNGLKVVITRKKENVGWWLLNLVVSAGVWCWQTITAVAEAIGSFCYSVVQFCFHLPGKIFNTISEYVGPYVKIVGDFIVAIAQPLLETQFGQMLVTAGQTTADFFSEAAYMGLQATEWVIEKGTQGVNYVSKAATKAVEWLGDTAIVKGTVGLVKDAGAWLASTEIWKSAAAIATYIYTAVSNFCTAVSESYQYYNQLRTASRRIALERSHLIDEHVILKTFHGISQQEARKNVDEHTAEEILRKSVKSWRIPIIKSLESTFTKKFNELPSNKYAVDFLKSSLQTSFALKNLEIEINDLLNFFAWKIQVIYFKEIQNAFQKNTPLKNIIYQPAENISIDIQFFIEDAFDEIIEEFQKRADNQDHKSDTTDDNNDLMNNIFADAIQYKDWKDAFKAVLDKLIQNAVDFVFIEKTMSVILAYIASVQNRNLPPSEAQIVFNQEDRSLKEALIEYNSNNESKRKTLFLITELHSIIERVLDYDNSNTNTIKTVIKYGYPLPLSATKQVATAIDNYLTKHELYKSGVGLEIKDDNENLVVKYSTKEGKGKIRMRHLNGTIFFCRNDYNAYVGMSDYTIEQVNNAFFYEALVGFLKGHLRDAFPRQAETLREGILLEL